MPRHTTTSTRSWDPAEYLLTGRDIAAYLDAALDDGDPQLVAAALGDVARARGMAEVARKTGLGRESLYKALSADGNPEFSTVLKVVHALGIRLRTSGTPRRRATKPAPRRKRPAAKVTAPGR